MRKRLAIRSGSRARSIKRLPLRLEQLEARLSPAFISVTTAADDITPNDGSVSLREAITAINAGNNLGDPDIMAQNPGTFGVNDSINFDIPGPFPLQVPFQINVGSDASAPNIPLPAITKPVTINGYTQPGFVPINYFFAPPNAISPPVIVLNGGAAGLNANGLDIRSGGVTIQGLDIQEFSANGILLEANDGTQAGDTIIDNYIGTDPRGTLLRGNHENGILIDGTNSNQTGLAASNNLIGGGDGDGNFLSGNGANGVLIQAHNGVATGNIVSFNYIGVGNIYAGNASNFLLILAAVALPNAGDGVAIDGASGNQIGEDPNTTFGGGNTLSGNGVDGVHIIGTLVFPAFGNSIVANHIGDDPLDSVLISTFDLAGQFAGIELEGATGTMINGNTIGGNRYGIELDNGAQNNVIQGNAVGILPFGTPVAFALSNDHGIELRSNDSLVPPDGPGQPNEPPVANNLIGGTGPGEGNIISYNNVGVVVSGNPVSLSGQPNDGNAILGNAIFHNSLIGITLSTFKWPNDKLIQTPNDSVGHGGPHNPNNSQNFPVLTLASAVQGPGTRIQGSLTQSVSPNTVFRIEFFANDPVAPTVPGVFGGPGQGQFFLGFTNVTTDASGHASFDVTLPVKAVAGQTITATATDPNGNTSEFSTGLLMMGASGRTDPRVYPSLISINGSIGIVTLTGVTLPSAPFQAAPGQTLAVVTPFPAFTGEIHRAVGDLNGDGIPDVVYAPGSGMSPLIHIVDGSSQATINNFYAFDPKFKGGIYVALADVNGDGIPDLIVAEGAGGAPEVKVIDGTKLSQIAPNTLVPASDLLADFYAFDPHFKGGVTVAGVDLNGDGHAEIITGAGTGSLVKIIDGTKLHQLQKNGEIANSALLSQFNAFGPKFQGGVFVAVGDVNGDGVPDVIVGAGAGGQGPLVKVIDGTKINVLNGGEISNSALLGQFFAFSPTFKGGVRVDAVDVNGDGRADIVLGAGGGTEIKVVDGSVVGTITGQPPPSAILLDFTLDLSSPTGLPTPMPLSSGLQLFSQLGTAAAALVDSVFASSVLGSQTGLSPDIGTVDLSKIYTDPTNALPHGRTLRDDVTDATFQLLTGNDGLDGSLVEFPYIGRPKSPPGRSNR